MFVRIIGVLIAGVILIVQELLKDKIKKRWINISMILLIFLSLIFSIIQFYLDDKDQKKLSEEKVIIAKQNKDLIDNVKRIEKINTELEKQNVRLILKVDSTNLLLRPFIETAQRKYPNHDNSEALDLLLNEFNSLKKIISDSKIEMVYKSITKVQNGYQIELQFKMTNNNLKDKIIFDIFLPEKSKSKILDVKPYAETLAVFNYNDGYSTDRKIAHIEFNISGGQIPNLRINLDILDQVLIKSNYLTNELEIK